MTGRVPSAMGQTDGSIGEVAFGGGADDGRGPGCDAGLPTRYLGVVPFVSLGPAVWDPLPRSASMIADPLDQQDGAQFIRIPI